MVVPDEVRITSAWKSKNLFSDMHATIEGGICKAVPLHSFVPKVHRYSEIWDSLRPESGEGRRRVPRLLEVEAPGLSDVRAARSVALGEGATVEGDGREARSNAPVSCGRGALEHPGRCSCGATRGCRLASRVG